MPQASRRAGSRATNAPLPRMEGGRGVWDTCPQLTSRTHARLSFTDSIYMALIDKITEDKIKEAADIVLVISDWVKLRRSGVEYVGLCPFHDDHTPTNFKVNKNKQMYKCFACGKGGDVFTFLKDKAGLDYGDALRISHRSSACTCQTKTQRSVSGGRTSSQPSRATWPTLSLRSRRSLCRVNG